MWPKFKTALLMSLAVAAGLVVAKVAESVVTRVTGE
jgi:hypothetical protein